MRTRLNTYTGYSIGCAGVWGAILLLAQRRLDSETRNTLALVCGGWWIE
jgi:nitrate reductase gamma subunit